MTMDVNQLPTGLDFRYADATRYLSAVGLIALAYDHILTLPDEVVLVWRAKRSFSRSAFLINRYLALAVQLAGAYYLNSYSTGITDAACQNFICAIALLGIGSMGIANILVLLRVVALWDNNKRVRILMITSFCVGFGATVAFMIATVIEVRESIGFNQDLHTCVLTKRSGWLTATWATPMIVEVFVIVATGMNALDRPRDSHTPLTKALHRDGILFFLALTALRGFNLLTSIFAPPGLILLGAFFVWAMTTTILNRSLLRIQKQELLYASSSDMILLGRIPPPRTQPFAIQTDTLLKVFGDDIAEEELERSEERNRRTPTPNSK